MAEEVEDDDEELVRMRLARIRAGGAVCTYLPAAYLDLASLEQFVEGSQVLKWADESRTKLNLTPNCELCVGLDDVAEGEEALGHSHAAALLLYLKERYGERVHLLNVDLERWAGKQPDEIVDPLLEETNDSLDWYVDQQSSVSSQSQCRVA